jgi:hypothetical protein
MRGLSKVVGELAGAQAEMNERLGRIVQMYVEGRTAETDRYVDHEERIRRLEKEVGQIRAGLPGH